MEIDPAAVGRRIADARDRRGLTQAQLAGAVTLDRTAIAKIEGGTRGVSALELARIAAELDERIDWFVQSAPDAVVSHRNLTDAPATTLDLLLEQAARDVEFVLHFDAFLPTDPSPRAFEHPHTPEDAERLASDARALLDLGPTDPAHDLAQLFSRIGFLGFSRSIGRDTADAGTILLAGGAVSIVNSANKVGRRRLAMSHELGHYLVADEYTIDWRVDDHPGGQAMEASLDRFARAVLLPPVGLRDCWEKWTNSSDIRTAALVTASQYRVDMSTLARRLLDLGLGDKAAADAVRAVKTTKADIVELDLLVAPELEDVSLPLVYQQAVLRLYRNETISPERCLELLRGTFDAGDLPELPPVSETEIWRFTS